jgi:hypothetical protein
MLSYLSTFCLSLLQAAKDSSTIRVEQRHLPQARKSSHFLLVFIQAQIRTPTTRADGYCDNVATTNFLLAYSGELL